ncbi:hypothetical protein [Chryseobacterium sp. MEBOG07]|uniref:hypothetical protein n=1 Tax=Chryseobacterium sp. MEBOG07 TaxID=2879939 RepID=UPI001F18F7ED|nr:hypothetical protein [Chryseobacterium sp. MEBOG07]UKB78552.1 hypothetical protein LF886_19090 [Chryseobacterium sp. MEBOG07]
MKKKKSISKPIKGPLDVNEFGHLITIKEIPLEKAMELLHNAGIEVEMDEAEEIMAFLYLLTKITLKEFFSPA